jgi:hypothetical protein
MPPKPRPIVNTHQIYNSNNPPPKKSTPIKATLINQPQISIPNVTPPVITPPVITPTAIIPKITLPTYSGPSGTAYSSYPTIQKQPEALSADTDNKEENILKKYPQLLLFIPLILIILSKNK